jgi:hypothetical protein
MKRFEILNILLLIVLSAGLRPFYEIFQPRVAQKGPANFFILYYCFIFFNNTYNVIKARRYRARN